MERIRHKIKVFFELIKFEHTVFALPFAYLGMMLARRPWPSFKTFLWVTVAMVSARTAGMTLNRLIDRKVDALNPRTKSRPILTGEFSPRAAWGVVGASLVLFFLSAGMLNPLCFQLSFIAVALLTGYHYVKRFSFLCHFSLGLVLAIAPMGGWLAVTGAFSWKPLLLSLAVLFWVAGFDIIYSLQDLEFDKTHGLHSIPVRFDRDAALKVSELCHFGTAFFLIFFGMGMSLGLVYWVGVAVCTGLLWFEHFLLGEGDPSKINTAFFTINGWIGILLLIFTFLDIFR